MSLLVQSPAGQSTPVGVLLPALSPDALVRLSTRFGGGTTATTGQLGTVPSWGVEVGMLTNPADRLATYAAHRASGAKAIYLSLYIHYQEDGVAYPHGIAGWNDFTANKFAGLMALAREAATTVASGGGGLYVFLHGGGDELGSTWVTVHAQALADAIRAAGLSGRVAVTPTFDSNANGDWSDPADNWATCNLALAAALSPDIPLFNWLPTGWARLGTANLSQALVAQAEAVVSAWCLEGPTRRPSLFLDPWPAILPGSLYDADHQVYQPTWASDASAWLQYVQVMGRRVTRGVWTPPPDAPYDVPGGLGIGGPEDGQPVTVSCDERQPPTYTTDGQVCRYEELFTFSWTHEDGITPAEIMTVRRGCLACGCEAVG